MAQKPLPVYHDLRVFLYLVMLGVFAGWLAAVLFFVFPYGVKSLKDLDPFMALFAGLGIGGISQFFILVLKDGWQFFFRKSGPALPGNGTPQPASPPTPSG